MSSISVTVLNAAYPVIIRGQDGNPIARVNPDRTWSLQWPAVIDTAYAQPTNDNAAIRAICTMLIAGRDNFLTSPWSDPPQPWDGYQFDIGLFDSKLSIDGVMSLFSLVGVIAHIDKDAVWSVDWDEIMKYRLMPTDASRRNAVPLVAFCEALYAAKDNFHTKPLESH